MVGNAAARVIQGMLGDALRHHQAGRLTEAERIYRQILETNPQHADSLHLLGMIAYRGGSCEAAAELIRKAIAIDQNQAPYHSNLGTALQAQGKLDEAAACYARALVLQPDLAEVHVNLGNILQAQGRLDEAVASQQRALALKPDCAEACYNLGEALQAQGKLDHAVACYERALALKPDYAIAHHSSGCIHYVLGNLDEALAQQRMAQALQPDYPQARFSESLAQLAKGDFAAGWHGFESRWQTKGHNTPRRAYPQPHWTGEKLASGRLLIWGEQGIGDEIMFAGLIPEVALIGNRCVLDCDARLKPLFARSFPGIDVVSGHQPGHNPELDVAAHLPCGSLPGLFRATHAAFAATASPYLIADSVERERFRTRYADGRPLVGLAWHTNNKKLPLFAPLFALPDVRWISLQYGDYDALQEQAEAAGAPILIDGWVDQFADMDTFAAQVAAMDMVLTIDNSTAHLAAALGVPVWLLLPFAADWRWLQVRESSPWYPTMRLFRQPKPGDWQSVVLRVQRALVTALPRAGAVFDDRTTAGRHPDGPASAP
jgi:tetratricopeptide (TPR) repeat protein